ncbi:MAG TPA: hypothetical protein VMW83_06975 [Spirochaetia bacterium]|nr:hypothetical protein [Spirochaetia bacterium]
MPVLVWIVDAGIWGGTVFVVMNIAFFLLPKEEVVCLMEDIYDNR